MTIDLEYPSGPVSLDSSFYVPRPPVEEQAYQEIVKPGSLIRMKAPKEMGKSSLMLRINHHAKTLGYDVVVVDCQKIDLTNFENVERFLRSFCSQVSHALHQKPNLDEYWDEYLGSKVNCTLYFQWYLLQNLDRPLLLCIHEIERIFEYPELAQEFFPLLRSWFEEAKQVDIWGKLRLLVVYSTEIYVPLKINQSPFNIGLPLTLPEFTGSQVQHLAKLHGLDWNAGDTDRLMKIVGGHPMLIRLALYHLAKSTELTLEALLESALTDSGIYREHLRRHLATLQADPELAKIFQRAIDGHYIDNFNPILSYKLESLGLVKICQQQLMVRCELYRSYFGHFLPSDNSVDISTQNQILRDRLLKLEQAKNEFEKLSQVDPLTLVANRRSFQDYLENQWRELGKTRHPLSIIFCDIDRFKSYNDTCGHQFGDECLKTIAKVLQNNMAGTDHLVARYGGDEFAIVLPMADADKSMQLAEQIRMHVELLNIMICENSDENILQNNQVTVSLGVASTIPHFGDRAEILIEAADRALLTSKKTTRNCVSLSQTLKYGAKINC